MFSSRDHLACLKRYLETGEPRLLPAKVLAQLGIPRRFTYLDVVHGLVKAGVLERRGGTWTWIPTGEVLDPVKYFLLYGAHEETTNTLLGAIGVDQLAGNQEKVYAKLEETKRRVAVIVSDVAFFYLQFRRHKQYITASTYLDVAGWLSKILYTKPLARGVAREAVEYCKRVLAPFAKDIISKVDSWILAELGNVPNVRHKMLMVHQVEGREPRVFLSLSVKFNAKNHYDINLHVRTAGRRSKYTVWATPHDNDFRKLIETISSAGPVKIGDYIVMSAGEPRIGITVRLVGDEQPPLIRVSDLVNRLDVAWLERVAREQEITLLGSSEWKDASDLAKKVVGEWSSDEIKLYVAARATHPRLVNLAAGLAALTRKARLDELLWLRDHGTVYLVELLRSGDLTYDTNSGHLVYKGRVFSDCEMCERVIVALSLASDSGDDLEHPAEPVPKASSTVVQST